MNLSFLSPIISVIALAVSLFTLWFTILRRGTVRSTHPAFIALRYDFVNKAVPQAKIILRALLFSTGKRGRVVESLFLRVREGEHQTEFSFWGMGDKDLVRGSGLFFSKTGIVTNHHFNPLDAGELFMFKPGTCSIELVAKLLGRRKLMSCGRYLCKFQSVHSTTTSHRIRRCFSTGRRNAGDTSHQWRAGRRLRYRTPLPA